MKTMTIIIAIFLMVGCEESGHEYVDTYDTATSLSVSGTISDVAAAAAAAAAAEAYEYECETPPFPFCNVDSGYLYLWRPKGDVFENENGAVCNYRIADVVFCENGCEEISGAPDECIE